MKSEFKKEKERKERKRKEKLWREENRLEEENKEENFKEREKGVELGAVLGLRGLPVFHIRSSAALDCGCDPQRDSTEGTPISCHGSTKSFHQSYSIPSDHNHTSTYALQQVAAIRRIVNMNVFGNQLCALEQVSSFSWASFPPFVKEGVELNDFLRPFRLSYFINW